VVAWLSFLINPIMQADKSKQKPGFNPEISSSTDAVLLPHEIIGL